MLLVRRQDEQSKDPFISSKTWTTKLPCLATVKTNGIYLEPNISLINPKGKVATCGNLEIHRTLFKKKEIHRTIDVLLLDNAHGISKIPS
jgi:hypothetical protein